MLSSQDIKKRKNKTPGYFFQHPLLIQTFSYIYTMPIRWFSDYHNSFTGGVCLTLIQSKAARIYIKLFLNHNLLLKTFNSGKLFGPFAYQRFVIKKYYFAEIFLIMSVCVESCLHTSLHTHVSLSNMSVELWLTRNRLHQLA